MKMDYFTETDNNAVALKTSGSVIVDFFMMFVRDASDEMIDKYMNECWKICPVKTIAIVFNARDRASGKKEKKISNKTMIWLRRHKYKTYTKNIKNYIDKYGCWKDITFISNRVPDNNFEIRTISKQLQDDTCNLDDQNKKVSLCAKWASSEKDKNNKKFNMANKIATVIFPNNTNRMEKYRKEILVPLRKRIDILESYMTSNNWSEINYENVPSIAMKRNKNAFIKHDEQRFLEYLEQVASGKKKINVTGILPHELINYYLQNNPLDETIELQWQQLLEKIRSQGTLDNTLAIVDTSGSMFDSTCSVMPIQVSVALGIIIAKCSSGHFANKVISFHETPTVYDIREDTLYEQVKNMTEKLPAGLSTNFEGVFDLLLNIGKMFNIRPEAMPAKIVCLSDMQFNEASDSNIDEETLHETIIKKYEGTGYNPPKFIYWNLKSKKYETFPMKANSDNVAMISGFSEQLLKTFMNNDSFDAEKIVYGILSEYEEFVIIDDEDV